MASEFDKFASKHSASETAGEMNFSGDLSGARAAIVNRTHRVVRERAEQMKSRRSSARDLIVPLLICSALLLMMSYALWTVLAGTSIASVGDELQEKAGKLLGLFSMDADGPFSVLFFWFLPVSAVAMGVVFFRRTQGRRNDEVSR